MPVSLPKKSRGEAAPIGRDKPRLLYVGQSWGTRITALDKWLRSQPPKVELAARYAIRGRFRNGDPKLDRRIDELYAAIKPNERDYAAILKHSREIGAVMDKEMGGERR